LAQDKDQTEFDKPDDDKEATENDTAWKDVISGDPDHDYPTADEGAATTNIGEVDIPSDEMLTIISEFKELPTRPRVIVAGYNTMHVDVDTKYEFTFKKAVQQTAPLDAIFPTMRRDPDSMTQQQTHIKE
jgi:hypothetical protein